MLFLLVQIAINVVLFFFLHQISVQQKESSLAEMALLRAELKQAQDQKSFVLEELSSRLASAQIDSSNTINGLHVFYGVVAVLVFGLSCYLIYTAFSGSVTTDAVIDCAKTTVDYSLQGDQVLAESLNSIDSHLTEINNTSLVHLSGQMTALHLKINELNLKISILAAERIPTEFDVGPFMEVIKDQPELVFSLLG